ncbi:MAG TPA: pyridoxamine 5'-phosphate oxidase family protein [Kofleriaceae bacterium]|nr:pyridoxamine 5'-phosphate oxidase family protein [Kofleriaceae bacterium]
MNHPSLPASERVRVRRLPKRGDYEPDTIRAILDEAYVCHLAFLVDGHPFALPTAHVRLGDHLYVHGSSASRMLRAASSAPVCVTVTLLDGLVLARSAFHHSMNYRSVVILATGERVDDDGERMAAMRGLVERLSPGRWAEIRQPNEQELRATSILRVPLSEASAKIRTGPPIDDEADMTLPCWAGVVPLSLTAGAPLRDG